MKRLLFLYTLLQLGVLVAPQQVYADTPKTKNKLNNIKITQADWQDSIQKIQKKLDALQTKVEGLSTQNNQSKNLENLNQHLQDQVSSLQLQISRMEADNSNSLWLALVGVGAGIIGFLAGRTQKSTTTATPIPPPHNPFEQKWKDTQQTLQQLQQNHDDEKVVTQNTISQLTNKIAQLEAALLLAQQSLTPVEPPSILVATQPPATTNREEDATTPIVTSSLSIRYVSSAINKGEGFEVKSLKEQLKYEYFELFLNESDGFGTFTVVNSSDAHEAAIQNFDSILAFTCEYGNLPNGRKKIVVIEAGKLQKDDTVWKITQKARIRFE